MDSFIILEVGHAHRLISSGKATVYGFDIGKIADGGTAVSLLSPIAALPQADGGSGLGLAICREIVGICNGRVTLESRLGQGALFTIALPN